jgi:3-dehydroquinate synthase
VPAIDLNIPVALGDRAYQIRIVDSGLTQLGAFALNSLAGSWAGRGCRNALVVVDANLESWSTLVCEALGNVGIETRAVGVPSGEASKSIEQAGALWQKLLELPADRHTLVVALGGGVIGDLAGFVAATYARGVPLLMLPTSLLAQVDSSIGGKVAINLPRCKNIVGAFHQPIGVWIDVRSLQTLPDRELRCGLAEVVKYGVIRDASLFELMEQQVDKINGRDPEVLATLIERSCRIKAEVIASDEREETGVRAALNFGHTVGHAIESVAGYDGAFKHGEAVAVGMVAECRLAESIGWIDHTLGDRVTRLLTLIGLPSNPQGLPPEDLLAATTLDKKNRSGATRFVLPRSLGLVELTSEVRPDQVLCVLAKLGDSGA